VVEAETRGPEPAYTESDFLRLCRRRAWLATAAAGAGTVAVAVVGRRLRAGWVVPASAATVAVLTAVQGPFGNRIWGDRRPDSCPALQRGVDRLARRVGIDSPTVVAVPLMPVDWAGALVWPVRRIYLRESVVPAAGEPVAGWLAGAVVHEMGHHVLAKETAINLLVGRAVVLVPVLAVGTGSVRRWALLSGAAVGLALLPGLWGTRWVERGADEFVRLLGYGYAAAVADSMARREEARSRAPRSWRTSAQWRPPVLRTHPTDAERMARLRSADGNPGRP